MPRPPLRSLRPTPIAALTTQRRESTANASADQCTNAGWRWCANTAQSDHAIAMLAGRSPSADENAYVAAVASRKNLYARGA